MRGVVVALVAVAVGPAVAWGWGCEAHRIVALVAWAELAPAVRERAAALVRADPVPGDRRGCAPAIRNPLADVAMWADAIREDEPRTAPWHYVDLPRDGVRSDLARHCVFGSCVTGALRRELRVLRSPGPTADRARALRFVVHLVADLHQPLHATTNGDRGGNCLPVSYLGERSRALRGGERWEPNLHSVWDTALVATLLARAHRTPAEQADALRRRLATDVARWKRDRADPDAWAWETHRVGVEFAYGRLQPSVPDEPHGRLGNCREGRAVGARLARLGVRIDDAYVVAAEPVVDAALARAGARLAALLDEALGGPIPDRSPRFP